MASTKPSRQLVICGAGPAGLSAAMRFADLGWDDIVLVERRQGPSDFEQNKAFNYLVEPRGEKLLDQVGVANQLGTYGVATDGFTLSVVAPDGTQKTLVPPIVNRLRGNCYWIRRARLQQLLVDGTPITLFPDLVLGCDGLSSQVRVGLMARAELPQDDFRMI